jgi:DcmR-like sensory protein
VSHICAFFNSVDEKHRVLRSFIREGLERGGRALHIVDPDLRDDHLKRLTDAGIDVEEARTRAGKTSPALTQRGCISSAITRAVSADCSPRAGCV